MNPLLIPFVTSEFCDNSVTHISIKKPVFNRIIGDVERIEQLLYDVADLIVLSECKDDRLQNALHLLRYSSRLTADSIKELTQFYHVPPRETTEFYIWKYMCKNEMQL